MCGSPTWLGALPKRPVRLLLGHGNGGLPGDAPGRPCGCSDHRRGMAPEGDVAPAAFGGLRLVGALDPFMEMSGAAMVFGLLAAAVAGALSP